MTTKWAMALNTFCNNYGRYVLTLPEHVGQRAEGSTAKLRLVQPCGC